MAKDHKIRIRDEILRWFDVNRRDLPWRGEVSPYAVWISEIMLQQTRVQAVIPYYRRWMERFPDLGTLAAAPEEDLLKCWEGMGYYSRARNIHKTARILAKDYGGEFPADHHALLRLPGIGSYTAGAVMSIAFHEDYPAVDGNVERVFARLFDIAVPAGEKNARSFIRRTAEAMIPPGEAGRFNQALMDLGATICVPRNPACPECPVGMFCESLRAGTVDRRPVPAVKKPAERIGVTVGVLFRKSRIFIQKRPAMGLLPNLWEFPGGKISEGESPEEALEREFQEELELGVRIVEKIALIRHSYTTFRVSLHAFLCTPLDEAREPVLHAAGEARWVTPDELDHYPFPAANRKLIGILRGTKALVSPAPAS
ncbi:MAG: A/G-specific adenine glycosylase [Syntrophobacteraceae bacterium]|nr:A/G-specific adenine glycosylase [Desulfobacteraceae bacterium]